MPDKHRFYIVDVFAEAAYAGNPLAVVLSTTVIPEETMQRIAAETNYSETTFVLSETDKDGNYQTRIFTPSQEIAFAGHPILGTAWVLRHYVSTISADILRLNIGVGSVSVRFSVDADNKEVVWFRAPPITLGASCNNQQMATALGISKEDIAADYPIQQISANTSAMIVPLRSLEALKRCKLNLDAYAPLAARNFPPLVYAFCHQTHHTRNDLCARFFFNAHGVREDPATGNGAAFLGYYLLEYQAFPQSEFSLRIEQGYEVRRPSLVMLHAKNTNGVYEVDVGGGVVPIVQGELV